MSESIVLLQSEYFVKVIVEELSGDEGCGQEKQPQKCKAIIAELIPLALPAIAAEFDEKRDAPAICNAAVNDVCKP